MPSFADSFWSADYSSGIDLLFSKLYQGCVENDEFLGLFITRMECENSHGKSLAKISEQHEPNLFGFGRDSGASLKISFTGLADRLGKEGKYHLQVAQDIKTTVLEPFGKWSAEHKQRIQYSEKILKGKVKDYQRLKSNLEKSQKKYINKSGLLEEAKSNFENEQKFVEYVNDSQDAIEVKKNRLGNSDYDEKQMKEIIRNMLRGIPKQAYKVTLLGTYANCSTGSSIVKWINKNLGVADIDTAEKIGQDLVDSGFLRLVGTVGKNFANSSQLFYQWKPYSYQYANVPMATDKKANLGAYFDDIMNNVTKADISDRASLKKLLNEAEELDQTYLNDVLILDDFRCSLEETVIDHYSFLEKCELDRLKALKKVTADFIMTLSNGMQSMKLIIEQLSVYEESIQPAKDLIFLLENYRTGYYQPKVPVYDHGYHSSIKQIFGIDLSVRCRYDKKLVPVIVSSILVYMDTIYPVLEDDETRLRCWIAPVKLQITHELRSRLNNLAHNSQEDYSMQTMHKIYSEYQDPAVITSTLKLYLLELPDSLISAQYSEPIKSLYKQYPGEEDSKRITGLTKFLSNLPTANVATLDSILTHFTRMVQAVDADGKNTKKEMIDSFVHNLANEFSTLILRGSQVNMANFFATKLFKDLLQHKAAIFDELKAKQRSAMKKLPLPPPPASAGPSSSSSPLSSSVEGARKLSRDVSRETSDSPISSTTKDDTSSTKLTLTTPNAIPPTTTTSTTAAINKDDS